MFYSILMQNINSISLHGLVVLKIFYWLFFFLYLMLITVIIIENSYSYRANDYLHYYLHY